MTLRLYLDDCAYHKVLAEVLLGAPHGHYVDTPIDSGLLGADDDEHFQYAVKHDLVIVTMDPDDFHELHLKDSNHAGVIGVYVSSRPSDMSALDIANAIQNLLDAGLELRGGFHSLNYWHYPRR